MSSVRNTEPRRNLIRLLASQSGGIVVHSQGKVTEILAEALQREPKGVTQLLKVMEKDGQIARFMRAKRTYLVGLVEGGPHVPDRTRWSWPDSTQPKLPQERQGVQMTLEQYFEQIDNQVPTPSRSPSHAEIVEVIREQRGPIIDVDETPHEPPLSDIEALSYLLWEVDARANVIDGSLATVQSRLDNIVAKFKALGVDLEDE